MLADYSTVGSTVGGNERVADVSTQNAKIVTVCNEIKQTYANTFHHC